MSLRIYVGCALPDLVFLKGVGVRIDDEDFAEALAYENRHRDISACHGCGVATGEQHKPGCPRSSILTMADRYPELRRREAHFTVEDCEFLRQRRIGV